MSQPRGIFKKNLQRAYWLRKAIAWGIETEGREEQAARDAEARYRREYRGRNKTG
jgi:hypothetical protein